MCLASLPNPSRPRPFLGWLAPSEPPADCFLHSTLFHLSKSLIPQPRTKDEDDDEDDRDIAKHIQTPGLSWPVGPKTQHYLHPSFRKMSQLQSEAFSLKFCRSSRSLGTSHPGARIGPSVEKELRRDHIVDRPS
jgi:hypothetical protein